jgi:hypothetical protein
MLLMSTWMQENTGRVPLGWWMFAHINMLAQNRDLRNTAGWLGLLSGQCQGRQNLMEAALGEKV